MWIDSHCHLNAERIQTEIGGHAQAVRNARAAGVEAMLTICSRISDEFEEVSKIANTYDDVWCSLGTHPHEASVNEEKSLDINQIINLAKSNSKVVAIGETGLDYYYNHSSPQDQEASFRKHLAVCQDTGLPVIVHARDADKDALKILKEEGAGKKFGGVLHCFTSSAWMAEEALAMGLYISFSGIVTFKKSTELQRIARDIVPLDRLLIETDSPYLAPEPYRGQVNQPAHVVEVGKYVSSIKSISEENIINHCKQNFISLFKNLNLKQSANDHS